MENPQFRINTHFSESAIIRRQKMNKLIVGATGATGQLLTEELLNRGQLVKVIVRSPDKLPAAVRIMTT